MFDFYVDAHFQFKQKTILRSCKEPKIPTIGYLFGVFAKQKYPKLKDW